MTQAKLMSSDEPRRTILKISGMLKKGIKIPLRVPRV
jgi:hypothetical protein